MDIRVQMRAEDLPLVRGLPSDQLHPLLLTAVLGMSYEQIAMILEIKRRSDKQPSVGTVKSRVNRGRTELRKRVKHQQQCGNVLSWGSFPQEDPRTPVRPKVREAAELLLRLSQESPPSPKLEQVLRKLIKFSPRVSQENV